MYFFFNDTATTEIYTLSLHDALPIFVRLASMSTSTSKVATGLEGVLAVEPSISNTTRPASTSGRRKRPVDRKSTRLNSSHANISYAVFCLKKKTNTSIITIHTVLLQS